MDNPSKFQSLTLLQKLLFSCGFAKENSRVSLKPQACKRFIETISKTKQKLF
jgi:hypothetical protein